MLSTGKLATLLSLSLLVATAVTQPLQAQPAPSGDIERSIEKLNELGTVLMIGAHPDDERTEVLAYFARARHMRAAYLSLTRGEGGQNLLGAEQGAALGLIRTQELMDARRLDGAEQFFTRAIDFGFSKTAEESMQKWGRDRVLSDIVWVIRRYRPDVVLLCFSGTPSDGHGHHQASAILGKEAFEIAGDPSRFPEQLKYVQPWKPAKLFTTSGGGQGGGRGPTYTPIAAPVQINTSGYDAIDGYTYAQLASISRSQHRSQGLGNLGVGGGMGGGRGGAAAAAPAPDIFDGIEHSWKRVPGGAAVETVLAQAARDFNWQHPEAAIPLLQKARPLIVAITDPIAKAKLADLDETIARCAAIWADAQAPRANVTPGSKVPVTVTVTARVPVEVKVTSVQPEGAWNGSPWTPPAAVAGQRPPEMELQVPASQPYSQPYFLVKPPLSGSYDVENQELIGLPDTPVERLRFSLVVAGSPIEITRPVVYRYNERLQGEKMRTLAVVPEVSVDVPTSPDLTTAVSIFPNQSSRRVQIAVEANVENAQGELRLNLPAGWKADPASRPFQLKAVGDRQDLAFELTPPAGETRGTLHAVAEIGGKQISNGMSTISYMHIPDQAIFPPSDINLVRSDIRVTAKQIGYIMGAGDDVPAALREIGLAVTILGEDELRKGDLTRFDAIVAGVRAYNVRDDLRANQQRLLDYVNNGGTYVVQYMSGGTQGVGPYPITIPTGNAWRVTVEEAPVTFPHPDSPLLLQPNRIGPRDFEGWVQERGLLFSTEWDPRYQTVLSSGDPGEKPLEGGELWTRYGKGVYIFSSYDWFRQLPAGVPGAFRLFANMLSAK